MKAAQKLIHSPVSWYELTQILHYFQSNHISFILCTEVESSLEEVEASLVIDESVLDETDENVSDDTEASGMLDFPNCKGEYDISLALDHKIYRWRWEPIGGKSKYRQN